MKIVETKLYSFSELSESAQEVVIAREAGRVQSDPDNFTLSEGMDSLRAIAEALGVGLSDWCIGPYNRNNFALARDSHWASTPHRRTYALVSLLVRKGYPRPKTFSTMEFPGICGFTGTWADDELAESILAGLLARMSWSGAFTQAAQRLAFICEQDLEYRMSRDGILETLDQTNEIYTAEGREFY